MEKWFQKVTQSLVDNGNISKEYEAVYQYALQSVVILGVNILLSLLIGVFLRKLGYCALFLCAMIPLRSDAGGYHASNLFVCYLLSFASLVSTLCCVTEISTYWAFALALTAILSTIIIIRFAPLDTKNRRLDDSEKKSIGKRARITVCAELAAGFAFLAINRCAAYTVWSAILWCAVGYVAWFIEEKVGIGNERKEK